jgi:hypothetical protein
VRWTRGTNPARILLSWSGSAGAGYQAGLDVTTVQAGHVRTAHRQLPATAATRVLLGLPPGATVTATVTPVGAGLTGPPGTATIAVPVDDTVLHADRRWRTVRQGTLWGTTEHVASAKGATATATVFAATLQVLGRPGPHGGAVQVWVDGKLRATVSERGRRGAPLPSVRLGWGVRRHVVRLIALSPGVDVDGFVLGYR